jgi:glycosyltransferase involved in cell wall biosynthesis
MFAWETLHSHAIGGVAAHVTELAAALERRGHEVHVFTRPGYGEGGISRIDGVWYHYCPHDLRADLVDEIQEMCRSLVWHFRDLEEQVGRFDVIHAHDWLASNALVWIKEARPDHLAVLTMHSTEFGRSGNNFWGGSSARIRDHERHGTYCADRVIAVSRALKRELMWMYELPDWKCRAIHNGVPTHKFRGGVDGGEVKRSYGIAPLDPTVLFCGRLCVQKGPDLLLEAIPRLLWQYPRAKFVFVGDGHMRAELEDRAWSLGVGHATRFLGYRSGAELIRLYQACDAVCLPSRNEPFGITALEGWAAGKAVVVTQNGGTTEFVWHNVNGLQIPACPDGVGWGIASLFSDFEWARWMGQNGRYAAETVFNWDTIAEQTERCYFA